MHRLFGKAKPKVEGPSLGDNSAAFVFYTLNSFRMFCFISMRNE